METKIETKLNLHPTEYRAAPGISASKIKRALRSLEHMDTETEATAAMQLGTALHMAMLEPDRFAAEYVVAELDRRTKAGKEAAAEHEAAGRTVLSQSTGDAINAMRESLLRAPASREFFDGSAKLSTEVSVFWRDEDVHPETAVDCKLRADAIVKGAGIILDLKTTQDASRDGFARSVANMHYHVQAAHYLSPTAYSDRYPKRFLFVAVETSAPWSVGIYELDAGAMEVGFELRERGIRRIIDADAREQWRGYAAGLEPQSLALPAWALRAAGVW